MGNKFLISRIGELVTYSSAQQGMTILSDVEMVIEDGLVKEVGKGLWSSEFQRVDAGGNLVTPGFVDAHTHPVFNDTREMEFEMRAMGKSYTEIANSGGGILSSVRSLRSANFEELAGKIKKRVVNFLTTGTTTIEAKSGYGLSIETELDSLRVLRRISKEVPVDIKVTFLGAHEYPPEYRDNHQEYIRIVIEKMLPEISKEGLADFCDVFCEDGVFSVGEAKQILLAAKSYGILPRVHADEFKRTGGAKLAAEIGAVSADHLVNISDEDIELLKEAHVIPILLPATTFFLGLDKYAPARKMLDRGLPVAISTDFNPGSSMTQSMPFVLTLACLKMGLTPIEAIQASTINPAKSLLLENSIGSIEVGKKADFVIWEFNRYQCIPYFLCSQSISQVWKSGMKVWESCGRM